MKKDFRIDSPELIEKIEKRLSFTDYETELNPPAPDDTVIMGTYSRFWMNRKHREVLRGKSVFLGEYRDSVTSLTRDYLTACYRKNITRKEYNQELKTWVMPLYSHPCSMAEGVYLDIRAAWWSIVNMVGWNVEFVPGRRLGIGQLPLDYPYPENKVGRSALVTTGISDSVPVWSKGQMYNRAHYNPLENRMLYAAIAYILQAIALEAITEFKCKYVATDGFIVPASTAPGLTERIAQYGLVAREKARGFTIVGGVGCYQVGPVRTRRAFNFRECDLIRRDVDPSFIHTRMYVT